MIALRVCVEGAAAARRDRRSNPAARSVTKRGSRSGEDRVGTVVLVERLEDDHFVAGIDDRHHRRDHRFGGAAADGDLALGIDRHALSARELRGDGVARTPSRPR